jgi:serine/threonine protein kinase
MSDPNLAHQTLGRYQLLVAVARGGMGQVWLGRLQGARGYSKLVAVKTLLSGEQDATRLESMLAEEARIASLIQHANVVHTIELGEHEGVLYLVMEWVDGEPLGFLRTRANERGGMPTAVAVALIGQVLAGLHAAHELTDHGGPLGVVHRDVSPHNILVTYEGVAKLLDFGIAKATHQSSGSTETGEIKGKFSYMAPEQILGGEVDRRCDIFAAGIVLYLLTTGKHPFKGANTAAVIHTITSDEPVPPPSSLVADYPSELEQVLLKALEKDVQKRWASAEEMRAALERAVPEAFDDAGRVQLRDFMERMVGDRKVARREAVRRAQLAADARNVETGARKALEGSAQSASSLRAISISQPAPSDPSEAVSELRPENAEGEPTPKRRRHKGPFIAAALGVVLAGAAMLPRFVTHEAAPMSAISREPLAPEQVAAAAPQPAPTLQQSASARPAEAVAGAAPEPAASGSVASASASSPPPTRPATAAKRKAAPATPAKKSLAGSSGRDDLLAPDYAR